MAVELQWTQSGSVVEEPFSENSGTSYTFVLKNIGDSAAVNVGFYLVSPTIAGEVDFPSSQGNPQDFVDVLNWGQVVGEGFSITQGTTLTTFTHGLGDKASNAIALTLGATPGTIAPGEEINLVFKTIVPGTEGARRLFVQVELAYEEV